MAYRPLYSGDLAALNVAAADQERNAIAARSGNQAFLQGLARVALERRGQDVDSSKAAADRENRLAIAQLLDATTRYSTDSNASTTRQRNANDLLSSIQRNEQELARLMVERDKVAALERQGLSRDQTERDKLAKATQQIAEELKNQLEIAKLQFSPDNRRLDARTANEIIAANAAIDDSNQQAAGLAEVLNSRIGKTGSWYNRDNADDIFRGLTPEQAALVQITEDAKKGRMFSVRPRARLGPDGRPMAPAPAPTPPLQPPIQYQPRRNLVTPYDVVNPSLGPTQQQFDPTFLDLINSQAR